MILQCVFFAEQCSRATAASMKDPYCSTKNYLENFHNFPTSLWAPCPAAQVSVGEQVPALATPLKPKFFLLGTVTIGAGQAVKLK